MPKFSEILNTNTQRLWPVSPQVGLASAINPANRQADLDRTPPKTPEELHQRVGAWQNFMQRMQTDPTLQQAVMMTGAQMLAGPQFMGENTGSIVGRALQTGILSHQMGKAAEAKRLLAEQEAQRANTMAQAQVGSLEASAEQTKQKTAEARETQPIRQKRLALEQQAAEMNLEHQPQLFRSQLATAESQRARNYALADKAKRPGGTGSPSKESVIEDLLRRRYPGATDQELAAYTLDYGKTLSQEDKLTLNAQANTLAKLVESGASDSVRNAAEASLSKLLNLPPASGNAADAPITEAEFWEAAKKAGPDGKFTLRGTEYKLKPGAKP